MRLTGQTQPEEDFAAAAAEVPEDLAERKIAEQEEAAEAFAERELAEQEEAYEANAAAERDKMNCQG